MNVAKALAEELIPDKPFYTTARDHKARLKETFQKGKEPGETCYLQSLDEIFTLRMGFVYCFTGWPGSGKSEFLTQLSILQANFKKRSIAVYSPESYPVDEFIDTMIHCYLGKSTDRRFPNVCTEKEYDQAIEWIDQFFMFCDWEETPDIEVILNAWRLLKKTRKVSIFIVDPFNSLDTEGEESNIAVILKKNLTKVKRFASQERVMIWLVEHPKTPQKPEEFDVNPGPRQLFGGTMWWNKVDVMTSVHRPNRDDKNDTQVIIRTWKVKNQKLNGRPGERTIHFDIKTNRYYESVSCRDHPMGPQDIYNDRDLVF